MSNAIFPTLPGLTWGITKNPVWNTRVVNSSSGREFTLSKRVYPIWHFKLPFDFLRAGAYNELQTLVGFINARRGRADDFLYLDPRDCSASNQSFGAGDGATTTFDLVRAFGGFAEPVGGVDSASLVVKVNGVTTAVTLSADWRSVTFAAPPASSATLTWSGTYYFRCRFAQDEIAFEQFLQDMYSAKSVEFKSFRP